MGPLLCFSPAMLMVWFRLFLSGVLLAVSVSAAAQESSDDDAGSGEKDWLEFYYENPTPDRLVPQMKTWADDGTLDNDQAKPALIAFLSQVFRQNRDRIQEWYVALAGLNPDQMRVVHTAMLLSRTEEADKLMQERFGKAYEEQKQETSKILEMPLDKRDTMDMLWGFYYATGSGEAIRRIVTTFRFFEAPDKPPGVDVPEGYVPLYKNLPQFALGSLMANGERHPRVVEILTGLLTGDETLLPIEREGIEEVLKELKVPLPRPPAASGKGV